MFNGIAFSSVFKIEEKPILRPCLSEKQREEIQRFKAKALAIERRLAEKNRNSVTNNSTKDTNFEVDRTDENIPNFVEDIESCSGQSANHTDFDVDNENFVTSISEWDISSIPGFDHDNGTVSLCSGATIDCLDNAQSHENTVVPALIRSDSFIVDEPSECWNVLKQLECSGVVVPPNSVSLATDVDTSTVTECNQSNPAKVFAKPVDKRKSEAKKTATPKAKKYPLRPFPFKKARIPSDNISNLPEKLIRKCQSNTVNVVDIRGRERQQKVMSKQGSTASNLSRKTPTSSMESSSTQTDTIDNACCINDDPRCLDERIAQIVVSIEEKFHSEIVSFLEKQKREQEAFLRKLLSQVKVKQEAFQCNLVMQMKELIDGGLSTLLKNQDTIAVLQQNTSDLINDVNGNLSSLEIMDNESRQSKEAEAASKINAFVRGYLTRRLFKTEHVQDVITTIRDSLFLVIDLHFENADVESVADIQMKHNLLQQLELSRHNLSHIFVTKTPADQMAMIAFDREMMMHRLLKSNSANKSNGPTNHHRTRAVSVEDKLKKLKSIKL